LAGYLHPLSRILCGDCRKLVVVIPTAGLKEQVKRYLPIWEGKDGRPDESSSPRLPPSGLAAQDQSVNGELAKEA
jgi:hypothetical protein